MALNLFLAILAMSYLVRHFLGKWEQTSEVFIGLAEDKKRNALHGNNCGFLRSNRIRGLGEELTKLRMYTINN
jgi:hypothetical protein